MTDPRADVIRQSFRIQARACADLGSPFTARLCLLMADRLDDATPVGERLLTWPGDPSGKADALALRIAGCLHALVLEGLSPALAACYPPATASDDALWAACLSAFTTRGDVLLERLDSPPQTNEVRRSGALLPGFLAICSMFGLPLALSEIGSSAGLNLQWDRYRYDLGGFAWGDAGSAVDIRPDWQGPRPEAAKVVVAERAGCDLNPLDCADARDRSRLMSYVWADQADRLARLVHAMDIAAKNQLHVERADAIDWLGRRLSVNRPGVTHVVFHSIAWQYLPASSRAEGSRLIGQAGSRASREAPMAWLMMESDDKPEGAALTLQVWPGGEKQAIGRADFHGRWVRWTGWPKTGLS